MTRGRAPSGGHSIRKWRDHGYSEASARGVTVNNGAVFFGTLDARVVALDALADRKLWESRVGPEANDGNYEVTSASVVAKSTVIVGSSIGENGRAEMERGAVSGFNANTGKLKWTWDPTPPGKTGAANAWAPMAVDERRDMVFIPTGGAPPDFYGGLRPGDNRHPNSVVALLASTGKLLWSFRYGETAHLGHEPVQARS